jgi:hypothetical protein
MCDDQAQTLQCSSADPMRTACWRAGQFASRLHQSVGSFARSVGPRAYVFAPSAGPKKALFASPRVPVRKPLQLAAAPRPPKTGNGGMSKRHMPSPALSLWPHYSVPKGK